MWRDFPKLDSMLKRILGGPAEGDVTVQGLSLQKTSDDGSIAFVEISILFEGGEIPPNIKKKAKNRLSFSLSMSDFHLSLQRLRRHAGSDSLEKITNTEIVFLMGCYRYTLQAEQIHMGVFQAVNELDLVENTWKPPAE